MKTVVIISLIFLSGCAGWSRIDKALLASSWGAATADTITTRNLLADGGHENNPMMGKYPDDTTLITYMVSSQIITTVIAHFFPKYRKALLGGKTILNTGCAIHNSNVD